MEKLRVAMWSDPNNPRVQDIANQLDRYTVGPVPEILDAIDILVTINDDITNGRDLNPDLLVDLNRILNRVYFGNS